MFYSRNLARFLHEFGHEAWISVTDDFSWQPKVGEYVFDI
jgi:hypothetical protein